MVLLPYIFGHAVTLGLHSKQGRSPLNDDHLGVTLGLMSNGGLSLVGSVLTYYSVFTASNVGLFLTQSTSLVR